MAKIKGILVLISFALTMLLMVLGISLFREKHHFVRKYWAKLQSFIMGYTIIQKGKADSEAKLVLVNHQSLVEIVALEGSYEKNLCWVAKQEIADLPIFGQIVKIPKMIGIDRSNKRSIIKIIRESKERISEGRVISMFPEGTRSDGKKLLKFQTGAKILAEKLNLRVQPVVVANTKYIFDSQKITAHSGNITIAYLDPIDPKENENWFEDMQKDMQKRYDDELANYTSHR